MDDELLLSFIAESREHLETIEADLLAIEDRGANIDKELVNKVFRAAHSIKGGSGFFGLERIKELAHPAETVLDMIRSGKLAPNAEIVNILLQVFDKLRDMVNHHAESNQADISEQVVALTGLTASYLSPAEKPALTHDLEFEVKGLPHPVRLLEMDVNRARESGRYIYAVQYDLIHDIERQGKTPWQVIKQLIAVGSILDAGIDFDAVGSLDNPTVNTIPFMVVHATVMDPTIIESLYAVDAGRIHLLSDPYAPLTGRRVPSGTTSEPVSEPPAIVVVSAAPQAHPPAPVVHVPDHVHEVPPADHVPQVPAVASAGAHAVAPAAGGAAQQAQAPAADTTLRVNVALLENLMNLAGELVLSRNQLHAAVTQDNRQLLASVDQRVNQVTAEIQDVIMQTRLQPIGNVFSKFPRVVRDLSQSLGKEIELDIQGKDVALDKTLIEGLSDPLTHMVRNAVDHGVETTQDRIAVGKPPAGKVRIEARHEAGQVVVEIRDDGKGIDPDRVAESAVSKGLITAEKAMAMSVREKQALIFLPGLSTAKKVTDVSGRGVGMDVVKTNLDRLGGQVEIISEVGRGSRFLLKLPLTLAIIPSLIVSVKGERFALPQANIEELLRLRPEEIPERIERVGNAEVLLLRDRVLPLARFDRFLGVAEAVKGGAATALEIAVVTTGRLSFALVVGAFHDTEEIVVKPLGRRLKQLREYSGATILGDGAVALILDVGGVAAKAGLEAVAESAREMEERKGQEEADRLQDVHALLLFNNGPAEPCALPLDLVQRIERITAKQVERLGHLRTMQYRGGSLPLVALSDAAQAGTLDAEQEFVVLVANVYGHEVGLLGTMPVDVVETRVAIDQSTHRQRGVAGSAIIRERTTLIADLFELVSTVHPDWASAARHLEAGMVSGPAAARVTSAEELANLDDLAGEGKRPASAGGQVVLLAEDSDFFRAQVKRYLEEAGLTVLAAPDGEAAWELLIRNVDKVRVVVTDIEMPRLSGLGLAERIRADGRTAKLPIIAVTSLAGEEDTAKGKAAGIDDYQVKLDRDRLLASVRQRLAAVA